jgi:uncharacterized protein
MNRVQAYDLMCEMIQNKNLRKHGLAVEAIMRALCKHLRERSVTLSSQEKGIYSSSVTQNDNKSTSDVEFNEEEWEIVGLLHDADYELIEKDPKQHTLMTEKVLREHGETNERIINGIKAHHEGVKETRDNLMEKAVYCADELSGLITAVALVRPDKKLASVSVESVMKKFHQKEFAKGALRHQIQACEKELDIPLEEFVGIALKAMQGISNDLGL